MAILDLISHVHLPSSVNMLPRWLKHFTFSSCFWSIVIVIGDGCLGILIILFFPCLFPCHSIYQWSITNCSRSITTNVNFILVNFRPQSSNGFEEDTTVPDIWICQKFQPIRDTIWTPKLIEIFLVTLPAELPFHRHGSILQFRLSHFIHMVILSCICPGTLVYENSLCHVKARIGTLCWVVMLCLLLLEPAQVRMSNAENLFQLGSRWRENFCCQ